MKIAFLTAGGIAPCLSASIGSLIQKYNEVLPNSKMIGYLNGYKGLLIGNSIEISDSVRSETEVLFKYGGSPIGNSRVKLTNIEDCVKKKYIKKGEDPLQVAADQLIKDGVNILHTIGGDDTNTMAAQLSLYLQKHNYNLTVVGLPKTVDNDVYPIKQTLGAWTAAEQGAIFFDNIVNENTTSSRQLIIHEVMGRNCGWLTAYTAKEYLRILDKKTFLPEINLSKDRWGIDAIYIPEIPISFDQECSRLKKIMDEKDCVNIFLSEGAGTQTIIEEMRLNKEEISQDAFGHVALDKLNPGQWFSKKLSEKLLAEKTLVQKSGYFARSAAANTRDLELIKQSGAFGAKMAFQGKSGVVGLDDDNGELSLIDFKRIKGGKPFDFNVKWYGDMLKNIGQ